MIQIFGMVFFVFVGLVVATIAHRLTTINNRLYRLKRDYSLLEDIAKHRKETLEEVIRENNNNIVGWRLAEIKIHNLEEERRILKEEMAELKQEVQRLSKIVEKGLK